MCGLVQGISNVQWKWRLPRLFEVVFGPFPWCFLVVSLVNLVVELVVGGAPKCSAGAV